MRFTTLISALAMLALSANAQDADLRKVVFITQEILFPKKIIPVEKRTYTYSGFNRDTIDFDENHAIKLNGFKRTDSGLFSIQSNYGGGLRWAGQETRSRVDIFTKVTYFSVFVSVICDGRIRMECKDIDYKWYIDDQFRNDFVTKEFPTAAEALREYITLQRSWWDEARLNYKRFVTFQTNYRANTTFGYAALNQKINLYLLKSKEHPEYENFKKNHAVINAAFATVKSDSIPKDILTKLQPAIDYFDGLPKQFADDNKNHKKVRYAAYYNLMKIYFHLEDFEKATAYANLVISNDYDGKDGKRMIEAIKEKRELWAANNASSSHFHVDGDNGFTLVKAE